MKERVDSAKIWRETPPSNGPASQEMPGAGSKMDAEVKAEVKDEDGGRKSTDSRPPSRKLNNGDSDLGLSLKTEDNNNKRIKLDKKADSIKAENGKPGSVGSESQKASPASSTTPQLPVSGSNTPSSIMCPSQGGNIVTSSEPPFMQQQSEIFVFSTQLANQAAESVRMGQCKSIIQYHVDHPNTKAFLQKHPLKSNNFRMTPQGQMLPGGGMKMQNPNSTGMMRMHGPPTSGAPGWGLNGPPMEDPSMMGPGGMMSGHPYPPNSAAGGPRMMGGWGPGPCGGPHPHPMGPGPGNYPPGSMMEMETEFMMSTPNGPINISSSQVPDEILTNEQRQHRSKGLAQLTKIHQMLMGANGSQDGRHGHPQMTGPDGRPCGPPGGMYPGGMPPGGMMTSQQQAMMSQQQQAMMSQSGMMPPHGMMSPQQQQHHHHMMAQQGMPPYGPRGPGPGPPGMNGKDQFHAQREWFHVQQEYLMEKQHRMQIRGPGGPHMEPVPPPSYYSSISQKHGGMASPTSPNMNGMRMPMGPHGPHGPPMGPGMDPESMAMYGGPPDMCRPPHMGMDPMAPGGMHGYPPHHGMPPQGPMDPGFDPTMAGAMPPGVSPGGPRHMGPQGHPHHPHMMGPNGMMVGPGHAKSPSQVTLHRAGNPEQFNPETMGGVIPPVIPPVSSSGGNNNNSGSGGGGNNNNNNNNNSKPPPSYAQAQKRKRDDLEDYGKGNLQQTPSPTKIQYHLNQFEGQELTITKQLNAAYVAGGNGGEDNSASMCPTAGMGGPHFNSHANSPLHAGGPGSNKGGPMSNSSQASAHLASPPVASTAGPSPAMAGGPAPSSSSASSGPAPSSGGSSGANMRLSHFDPSSGPQPMSNGIGSAPHTPNPGKGPSSCSASSSSSSSSLSNITSASLANLAKGVENLSNQMQQNMMQGGPFHSIQVQGQMGGGNAPAGNNGSNNTNSNVPGSNPVTNNNSNNNNMNSGNGVSPANVSIANSITTTTAVTTTPASSIASPASAPAAVPSSTPSVNNTYIATNMSISQVNVPNHPGMNSYVNMQMQSMSSESSHHNMQMPHGGGGPNHMGPMMGGPRGPAMSHHQMSQSQAMMGGGGPMMGMHPSPQGPPHPMMMPPHGPSPGMPPTPPIANKGPAHFASPPLSHAHMTGSQPPSSIPPGGVTSPQFPAPPPSSASNSSVQIQQKGHNTIQYLPANPPASANQAPPLSAHGGKQQQPQARPEIDYSGMPRFPSPHSASMDAKNPSTLQYFPTNSPTGGPRPPPPMSSAASSLTATMGPEFANQATIAMHQSAAMRSPSLPDTPGVSSIGPQAAAAMGGGHGNPMDPHCHPAGNPMGRPSPMMGGHHPGSMDPMMNPMGPGGNPSAMRPGHSPGVMRPMHPPVMGSGSLECVSPIPGMGGYMNSGPSIEQAQAQAQAHAAMMMQGNTPLPGSSPHAPSGMAPTGGPSPHMAMHGGPGMPPASGMGPHGSSPHGMPHGHGPPISSVPSPHGTTMGPGPSPHAPPMGPGPSPHAQPMGPGPSPHGPMGPVPSPHGHMGGPSPHSAMTPHGPMGPMHGPSSMGVPPGSMARHPGMGGVMRMPGGPAMGPMPPGGHHPGAPGAGQYGNMQYPQYQPDFYHPQSRGPRQMVHGMMGGPPTQPYGMMPNMPGPS